MNGAIMTLARWHAKEAVKKELYAQGIKLRHVEASEIARAAIKYIDEHPEIIEKALESYRRLVASGRLRPRKLKLLICKDFHCANIVNEMETKDDRRLCPS